MKKLIIISVICLSLCVWVYLWWTKFCFPEMRWLTKKELCAKVEKIVRKNLDNDYAYRYSCGRNRSNLEFFVRDKKNINSLYFSESIVYSACGDRFWTWEGREVK